VNEPHIDTDVIVRLVTGDDRIKQAQAADLFQAIEAGTVTVRAPVTVIADAVFVLCSKRLYNLPRVQAAAVLARLVGITGFQVDRRRTVLTALNLFGSTALDFGDCMLIAAMRQAGSTLLYSFDTDFDQFSSITRTEPGKAAQDT
jgi:predicted nucleic-acid-binding protein